MPLFSVIVPVYNVEPYLEACLDSILGQTCKDFELILVDDGSTDGSAKLCDQYASMASFIKVIHKTNGGLVSARQAGVRVAEGDYCVAIDSDDWVASDYLELFKNSIDSYSPDIVCTGICLVDGEKRSYSYPALEPGRYDREAIVNRVFPRLIQSSRAESFEPNICSKAIKKEIYRQCQLAVNRDIRNGEDSACTIPCFYNSNSLHVVKGCGYYYRYNRASMTKDLKPMPWRQQERITRQLREAIDVSQYDFDIQISRRICHSMFNICVSQFYGNKPYRVVKKEIKSHLHDPECQSAIRRARFTSAKARIMFFALRHEAISLMWLYAKMKKRSQGVKRGSSCVRKSCGRRIP